jgi:hypothetical protein
VRRVRPGVCGRDDRRAPPVSGLKSEGAYRFGREGRMGRGLLLLLGWKLSPWPFFSFPHFSFLFFSFVMVCYTFQNGFKQLLKPEICFPSVFELQGII